MNEYRFYASSILIVYECGADSEGNVVVKLIDFTHAYLIEEEAGRDENVIYALRSIIDYLSKLL